MSYQREIWYVLRNGESAAPEVDNEVFVVMFSTEKLMWDWLKEKVGRRTLSAMKNTAPDEDKGETAFTDKDDVEWTFGSQLVDF